jgi:RimJ/RimL family protein N-acetyltransferase
MIDEESFIDFKCPHCDEAVSFPETDSGFARACPICTETMIVPSPGEEKGGKLPLPSTTSRLLLRRFIAGDWRDLLEIMSNEEVFRYTSGGPLDEDEVLRWIELDQQVRLTTPDQTYHLGIQMQEGEKLVGVIGLRFSDPLQPLLHIIVHPAFQRNGVGSEAVRAALEFCFKGIHVHRVVARCDSRNTAALRMCEKAGLRREGEFVKDTAGADGWQSTVSFALLEEEMA